MKRDVILLGVSVGVVVAVAAIALTVKDIRANRPMSRRSIATFCAAGVVTAAVIAYAVF